MVIAATESGSGSAKAAWNAFDLWLHKYFNWGELLLFVLCIGAGVVVSMILKRVLGARLRAVFGKKDPVLGDRIVDALTAPLWIFVLYFFFDLGLMGLSGLPVAVKVWLSSKAPLVFIVATFIFVFRCMDIVAEVLRRRWSGEEKSLNEQWAVLVGNIGKFLVALVGTMMVLKDGFNYDILPLLTGASFLGAGVALASKGTIENIIGSFEIMVDRLFKEGDRISFQSYDGFVTRMGMRSVQITSMTGERITLPNKAFVDQQIHNCSRKGKVLTSFNIGLVSTHTRADIERAMAVLKEIIDAHPKAERAGVVFKGFGPSSLDLGVSFWGDYTDGGQCGAILSELNLAIKERFDAEKLEMAYPTSTIYVKNAPPPLPC